MMATDWFISDPHFGHARIIDYEPIRQQFGDKGGMDEAIIARYNETVSEGDTVYWLGDMFFCGSERMNYIVSKLTKTRNILIRGNHDRGVSNSKFIKLGFYPTKMHLYRDTILTHEPVSEENMRHLKSIGIHHNVHGHVHSSIEGFDVNTYCCVSVENTDFKPISNHELALRLTQNKKVSKGKSGGD